MTLTNQLDFFVHYNREFVITEFVITEFDCITFLKEIISQTLSNRQQWYY